MLEIIFITIIFFFEKIEDIFFICEICSKLLMTTIAKIQPFPESFLFCSDGKSCNFSSINYSDIHQGTHLITGGQHQIHSTVFLHNMELIIVLNSLVSTQNAFVFIFNARRLIVSQDSNKKNNTEMPCLKINSLHKFEIG